MVVGVGIFLGISLLLVASKMTAGALHEDASKALYIISGAFYEVHSRNMTIQNDFHKYKLFYEYGSFGSCEKSALKLSRYLQVLINIFVLSHWQVNANLLKTQMEAFAVAMKRQLPSIHPIFQLLHPHLCTVTTSNTVTGEMFKYQGRNVELLQKIYKAFKFGMLSVPEMLKEREVDDVVKLPNFHYR